MAFDLSTFQSALASGGARPSLFELEISGTPAGVSDTALGNLTVTHGTAAGNICRFSSTKVDIGDVTYGEMDGVTMLEIPYTLVPSSANDELSIVYT